MTRHLLHAFPSFNAGGMETRTSDIINHFGNRYRHTIIALDRNLSCREKINPSLDVQFLEVPDNKSNLLANLKTFTQTLKKINPDLLLTYNFGSVEWSLASAIANVCPELHWEEGFTTEEATKQLTRRIYIRRLFLARTRKIIVVSRQMQKIATDVWKFSPKKVLYLPNGVDLKQYANQSAKNLPPELSAGAGSLLIGTVARLRQEKNIPRLLRVFREATQNVNAKLVIVGSGEMYEPILRHIQELNLTEKVIMTGYINDPSAIVKALDILAISSDTEQMPISVLEAMAAGIPVVGTDVGDIKEMIAPLNVEFLCQADDENAFVKNLKRLMADEVLRGTIGVDNIARSQANFDKQLMFDNYEKLYELDI